MARAQSFRSANRFDRGTSRRSRQMANDIMKTMIVLCLIIIGYFAFAPQNASSKEESVSVAKK